MADPTKSVLGEGFDSWVREQVNTRQSQLSLGSVRDNNLLKYLNTKTAYLRLASSVNISGDNSLSSKYTLEAAKTYTSVTENEKGEETVERTMLSGVGYSGTPLYGWASDSSYGFVPPPGILSADIKTLNKGSLKEATVKIVCHSPKQFKIIDALYLKLKYTMLLEWGHTLWYNNSGELKSSFPTIVYNKFVNNSSKGTKTYRGFLDLINDKRAEFCGNYDAFIGQVKNFDWTLRNDGGYDITLTLISMGDIIESLKINPNYPNLTSPPDIVLPASGQDPPIKPAYVEDKNKSILNQILFGLKAYIIHSSTIPPILNNKTVIDIVKQWSKFDLQENFKTKTEKDTPDTVSSEFGNQEFGQAYFQNLGLGEDGTPQDGYLYYIKLGALLRLIQNFVLKYNTAQSVPDADGDGYEPLFRIDYNYDTNICLTLPIMYGIDPKVCMLKPRNLSASDGNWSDKFLGKYSEDFRIKDYDLIGKFMHIYVNFDFIAETLRINTDEEGKVSVFNFLTQLMVGIQSALGGINNFEVTYDESVNQLVIRDMSNLPGCIEYLNRTNIVTRFNTHLLKNTEGSFVYETGLKTELNNMFSSLISIGAQVDGNKIGENATVLSQLNEGYTDRIMGVRSSVKDDEISTKTWVDTWKEIYKRWKQSVWDINEGWITAAQVSSDRTAFTDFYLSYLGEKTNKKETVGTTLLPLSLNLKMDGLSGMKQLQTYTIDDTLLPPLYQKQVQFLIKGITHHISDKDGWTTTIESIGGPRREGIVYQSAPVDTNQPPRAPRPAPRPIPSPPSPPPAPSPPTPPRPPQPTPAGQIRADVWSAESDFFVLKENGANTDLTTVGSGQNLRRNKGLGNNMSTSNINTYKNNKSDNKIYWAVYDINADVILAEHNGSTNIYGASVSKAVTVGAALSNNDGKYTNDAYYKGATRLLIPSDNNFWDEQSRLAGGESKVDQFSTDKGYNNMKPARHPNKINAVGMSYFWRDVLRGNFKGADAVFKITSAVSTANGRSRKYLPSNEYIGSKTGTWNQWTHDSAWFQYNGKWYTITVLTDGGYSSETVALMFGGLHKEYVQQIRL